MVILSLNLFVLGLVKDPLNSFKSESKYVMTAATEMNYFLKRGKEIFKSTASSSASGQASQRGS